MMGLNGTYTDADSGILSLEEAAVGLSREGRFANQTILRWTVADHLLACMHLAGEWNDPRIRLLVGLHDYHESMLRDVPTTFKTNAARRFERKLDKRLYAMLEIKPPTRHDASVIHFIDKEMLLAEASLVAPLATYKRIKKENSAYAGVPARRSVKWVLNQQLTEAETAAEWLRQIKELLK